MERGITRSELVRLTADEQRLVHNFRVVNEVRQDTLLYFSDELVKLESVDVSDSNVVQLTKHQK